MTIHRQTGGLAVLKGNLAPDGGVVKRSAVVEEMMVHEGPARVFDCEEDAINTSGEREKIVPGDVSCNPLRRPERRTGNERNAESYFRNCRHGTWLFSGSYYGRKVQRRVQEEPPSDMFLRKRQ